MLTKTRLIRHSIILFVLICAITGYVLLSSQNPLHMDALTEYNHERKKIDIALTNNGFAKIQLLKVQVNDRPSQADVQPLPVMTVSWLPGALIAVKTQNLWIFTKCPSFPIFQMRK